MAWPTGMQLAQPRLQELSSWAGRLLLAALSCLAHTLACPSSHPSPQVEFATVSSAYHVEMNPSDVGNNDR